jgi:hypothetical protein
MTAHHVAELCLRVRAGEAGAPDLRPRAERFARAVLERCAGLLEARAPGRVVLIRRLPLRWRLSEAALAGAAALERCAADIAAAVEEVVRQAGAPAADSDVAVFEDESHWRASHLLDGLRGRAGAWFYAPLEAEGDPVEALCAPQRRGLALGLLARLETEGRLIELLAALPPAQAGALAEALGAFPPWVEKHAAEITVAEGAATPAGTAEGPVGTRLAEFARALPSTLSVPALLLALHVRAHALLGPAAAEEAVQSAVTAALAARPRLTPPETAVPRTAPAAAPLPPEPLVVPPAVARAVPPSEDAGPGSALPLAPGTEPPAETVFLTRFGGLFYLLTCALELDLGEALWKACLPEGDVLAQVAAAVLGPEAAGDPAPRLFGGVEPGRPLPPVTPEQQQEVAAALIAPLAAALPRRGLADFPELVLDLVAHATGRLLVVATPGSPFAVFTWPATSAVEATAGLRAFLRVWPRSAPPVSARPALAELDASGRLHPGRGASVSSNILIPAAPSPEAAALLAQAAGVLCGLFAARTGKLVWPDAAAFIRRYLALPTVVTVIAGEMLVTLPEKDIDLSIRRAGLDRDPGWIPWLARAVRLTFQGIQGEA